MVRVVLDTNVIISAALKPGGNERKALEAIRRSSAVLIVSPDLFSEYQRVVVRPKFEAVRPALENVLSAVRREARFVRPTALPRASPDPDDDIVLACAQAGAADYIVTGNLRDFPSTWNDTAIVNARTFLVRLAERSP